MKTHFGEIAGMEFKTDPTMPLNEFRLESEADTKQFKVGETGELIEVPLPANLRTISKTDLESYAREAKEMAPKITRFITKNRAHIGAVYLVLDFLKKDIEKNYPEVKGLLAE